jgi:hypothetical protein
LKHYIFSPFGILDFWVLRITLVVQLQFMLDMICDIKNNKRRPKDELVVHSRLKKWLQKVILSAHLVAQSGFWFALKGYMLDLA